MVRRSGNAPANPFRVFISYRRSDSSGYARSVYDALTEHFGPGSVFFDIDSIAPGRDFVEVLHDTLARTDVLLVVMGPTWADAADDHHDRRIDDPDDLVRLEVETALRNEDLLVVPVLVGGARMPPASALPEGLASLTRRNATSLIDEHWRSTMGELIAILERIRGERALAGSAPSAGPVAADVAAVPSRRTTEPRPGSGRAPGREAKPGSRRTAAIVIAVVGIAVLVGVGVVAASSGGSSPDSKAVPTKSTEPIPEVTQPPASTGPTAEFALGDCADTKRPSDQKVACSEPHDIEVTNSAMTYPAGPTDGYPDGGTIQRFFRDQCEAAFRIYVGRSSDESRYDAGVIFPDEAEWASGARWIYCTADGVGTGSLRGSNI